MKDILLIGSGSHIYSCIDVIECQKKSKIKRFIDRKKKKLTNYTYNYLGKDKDLVKIRKNIKNAHISVGQIKNLNLRSKLYLKAKRLKYYFPKIISPNAYISKKANVGEGTIIMHGVIINANAVIGKNCIINTGAIIEHDVKIGNHCHISTGAKINGGVKIENNSFVGSGTVVKQEVKISSGCFINANLFIDRDLKKNVTKIK